MSAVRAGLVVSVLLLLGAGDAALAGHVRAMERIDHIVVIVEENHTFDSYFGSYPGADGFDNVRSYPLAPGHSEEVFPIPWTADVNRQFQVGTGVEALSNGRGAALAAYNGGAMDGFVRAQANRGFKPDLTAVFHDRDSAPGLWALADEYVLFDRFFSSTPGGSFVNMLHLIAGQAGGYAAGTKAALAHLARHPIETVFDRLQAAGLSWRYYVGRLETLSSSAVIDGTYTEPGRSTPPELYWAPVLAMPRFWRDPELSARVVGQEQFVIDAAQGSLPAVSFVLPSPTDHPPATPRQAESRLLGLVNAVAEGPAWPASAIFVVWDDWGGFYDHVPPPLTSGFRVPALLVSPLVKRGYISSVEHDHTSILNFILDRFGLPALSERQGSAHEFRDVFTTGPEPRDPVVFSLERPDQAVLGTPDGTRYTLVLYLGGMAALLVCVLAVAVYRAHSRRASRPEAVEP